MKFIAVAASALLVAGGMVSSAVVLSKFMVKIQRENTISVKGLSERSIESDMASFECRITSRGATVKEGYEALGRDVETVLKHLKSMGFADSEIEQQGISYQAVTQPKVVAGQVIYEFSHYSFSRDLRVLTNKLDTVQKKLQDLNGLLTKGIVIKVESPEFYVTDLEQYKLRLITEATASAVERARATAEQLGGKVGKIIMARNGVIQITRPASSDSSDYGYFDTTSRTKVMKVVVAIDFEIN